MKKVTYFLVLMFSLVLTSASCDKSEDPIVPDTKTITAADLAGDWNFESLEIGGKTYTGGCSIELDADYNYGALSLLDVVATPESKASILDICTEGADGTGYRGNFSIINNEINVDNVFKFTIENAKTFNGTVLKLKLLSIEHSANAPIGGIYTLTYSPN